MFRKIITGLHWKDILNTWRILRMIPSCYYSEELGLTVIFPLVLETFAEAMGPREERTGLKDCVCPGGSACTMKLRLSQFSVVPCLCFPDSLSEAMGPRLGRTAK